MMARIHEEMIDSISHLDEDIQNKIIMAYVKYQLYGTEPNKDDILVYSIFKCKQFDLDAIKSDVKASIENGAKGWRPEKNWENSQKPKHNLKQPKHNLKKPEKEKEKEKEIEIEKENIIDDKSSINEFDDALSEFVLMRKSIKKPITQKWIDLIKWKLNEMYPEDTNLQIKCLYKSIENSWQWVFPLKDEDIKWYSPPWKRKIAHVDPNKVLSIEELWWYKSEN